MVCSVFTARLAEQMLPPYSFVGLEVDAAEAAHYAARESPRPVYIFSYRITRLFVWLAHACIHVTHTCILYQGAAAH